MNFRVSGRDHPEFGEIQERVGLPAMSEMIGIRRRQHLNHRPERLRDGAELVEDRLDEVQDERADVELQVVEAEREVAVELPPGVQLPVEIEFHQQPREPAHGRRNSPPRRDLRAAFAPIWASTSFETLRLLLVRSAKVSLLPLPNRVLEIDGSSGERRRQAFVAVRVLAVGFVGDIQLQEEGADPSRGAPGS